MLATDAVVAKIVTVFSSRVLRSRSTPGQAGAFSPMLHCSGYIASLTPSKSSVTALSNLTARQETKSRHHLRAGPPLGGAASSADCKPQKARAGSGSRRAGRPAVARDRPFGLTSRVKPLRPRRRLCDFFASSPGSNHLEADGIAKADRVIRRCGRKTEMPVKVELLMRRGLYPVPKPITCCGPPRWGKEPEYSTQVSHGRVSCRSKNTLD